jgi:hypothetical protein
VEWTSKTYIDPNNILNPSEEQQLDRLLKKMANAIVTHRLLVKPFFQDKVWTSHPLLDFDVM